MCTPQERSYIMQTGPSPPPAAEMFGEIRGPVGVLHPNDTFAGDDIPDDHSPAELLVCVSALRLPRWAPSSCALSAHKLQSA